MSSSNIRNSLLRSVKYKVENNKYAGIVVPNGVFASVTIISGSTMISMDILGNIILELKSCNSKDEQFEIKFNTDANGVTTYSVLDSNQEAYIWMNYTYSTDGKFPELKSLESAPTGSITYQYNQFYFFNKDIKMTDAYLSGSLSVAGNVDVEGDATLNGDVTIGTEGDNNVTLEIKNNTIIGTESTNKNLTVNGTITGTDSLTINAPNNKYALSVTGRSSNIHGNVNIDGGLTVNENVTIKGITTVEGAIKSDSVKTENLIIDNATSIGDLTAKNIITDNLRVNENITFEKDITLNGNIDIGDLDTTVSGYLIAKDLTAKDITATSITSGGELVVALVEGDENSGKITANNIKANDVNLTGQITANNITSESVSVTTVKDDNGNIVAGTGFINSNKINSRNIENEETINAYKVLSTSIGTADNRVNTIYAAQSLYANTIDAETEVKCNGISCGGDFTSTGNTTINGEEISIGSSNSNIQLHGADVILKSDSTLVIESPKVYIESSENCEVEVNGNFSLSSSNENISSTLSVDGYITCDVISSDSLSARKTDINTLNIYGDVESTANLLSCGNIDATNVTISNDLEVNKVTCDTVDASTVKIGNWKLVKGKDGEGRSSITISRT